MRQYQLAAIAWSFLGLLLIGPTIFSTFAQTPPNGRMDCGSGVLTTTIPAPPKGMANFRTIRLDESCQPVAGSIQTVPIEQLPAIALDPLARSATFTPAVGLTAPETRHWGSASYHAEQAVFDVVNITLNKLYGTTYFTFDGARILSYSANGGAYYHQENKPPSCAKGWRLKKHYNAHVGGGAGASTASFVQYAEFKYKGFFDCRGKLFYNKLANHSTIYANGTGSCQFTQHYRTWSLLWYWTMACY